MIANRFFVYISYYYSIKLNIFESKAQAQHFSTDVRKRSHHFALRICYTHFPMIATLHGVITRLEPEHVIVDVQGVGYAVQVPINVWDELSNGAESTLHIHTYVREDRLDLFGFSDRAGKTLFQRFIALNGIGPKHALELSAVPKSLLMQAIGAQDPKLLTTVKGIGKKTAEKLLLDLKSLAEKQPDIFGTESGTWKADSAKHDQDVIDALKNLGYDTATIMHALAQLPDELTTSEERVAAALKAI